VVRSFPRVVLRTTQCPLVPGAPARKAADTGDCPNLAVQLTGTAVAQRPENIVGSAYFGSRPVARGTCQAVDRLSSGGFAFRVTAPTVVTSSSPFRISPARILRSLVLSA